MQKNNLLTLAPLLSSAPFPPANLSFMKVKVALTSHKYRSVAASANFLFALVLAAVLLQIWLFLFACLHVMGSITYYAVKAAIVNRNNAVFYVNLQLFTRLATSFGLQHSSAQAYLLINMLSRSMNVRLTSSNTRI